MSKQQMMRVGRSVKMMTGLLGLLLVLALSERTQAQTENWQTYDYPSEGLSFASPAVPVKNAQNVPTEAGNFELRSYMTEIGNTALFVGICDYGSAAAGRDPNDVLQGAKTGRN